MKPHIEEAWRALRLADHDLVKLAGLLRAHQIRIPVQDKQLRQINPFAVTMRYDELEITINTQEMATKLVQTLKTWAEEQVKIASENA